MSVMKTNEVQSRQDFEKTVDSVREAIETAGLKVVSTIDAQENLKKIGLHMGGNKILEVFHPKLAKEVFDNDIRAGIVPPLRIYIFEDGSKTYVVTQSAVELFSPYHGLSDLAKRIDEMLNSVVNAVR